MKISSVEIELDGGTIYFRISYVGKSPADFRRFAQKIKDGENENFVWVSEPGAYLWQIQCRGGIFYVNVPQITNSFFISRLEFLGAIKDLTGEWRI